MFSINNSPEKFRRLISAQEVSLLIREEKDPLLKLAGEDLLNKLSRIEENYSNQLSCGMNTSLIILQILNFAKEEISSRFIPLLKGVGSENAYAVLNYSLQQLLILLNPSIPFITSYLYLKHTSGALKKLDLNYHLQIDSPPERFLLLEFPSRIKKLVDSFCKKNRISLSDAFFELDLLNEWLLDNNLIEQILGQLRKTERINIELLKNQKRPGGNSIRLSPFGLLYFSVTGKNQEFERNQKDNDFYKYEIARTKNLLNNKGFVEKAPRELVDLERKKLVNYYEQ